MSRFYLWILAGVLMIIVVPGCGRDETDPGSRMEKAGTFFAKKNYHQAVDIYRQIVADDPGSIKAWSELARACIQLGDTQGAIDAYQRIIRLDPVHVEALLSLARFDILEGETKTAEERIARVLQSAPENTEALFLMADLYDKTNRIGLAEKTYEQILPISSDKTRALTGLAQIQARKGDLDSALKNLEKAVALAPGDIEARLMLFNYYCGQDDYQNAEKALLTAITENPSHQGLRILLGKYYYSRNRTEDAEESFLKAVELDPDEMTAYLVAGKFYSAISKPEAALKMFQKAARLQPRDLKVRTLLAEFYLEHNFLEDAGRTIADILDSHPAYFPARLLKIRMLIAGKDYDQAILLCESYLQANPAADSLLVLKGIAHVERGDLEQAEESLTRAVNVAPENINARFRLLDVYMKQNKIEQSQQLTRDIFGYLHKNFDVTVVLGDTELHKEKKQKGLDSLDSFSQFASFNPYGRFRTEHLKQLRADYDRLMSGFSRVLEKRPDLISIFEDIVLLHAARNEYGIALAKCDQQIERLEEDPCLAAKIHNIKGGLYLAQNNIDQAKVSFKQAIDSAPDFLKPYYGLAKIYIINKDIDNAINQYKALLERDPRQPVPYLLLGVLHKMKADFPAAENYYRQALALDPAFVQAANNLAYLLTDQNRNLDEALTLALHAKALRLDDPYVLDTLGWVYYRQGLYDDAVRELSLAVSRLPDNSMANYHLGMAYYQKGCSGQAGRYLEKALQSGADFREADEARRILAEID